MASFETESESFSDTEVLSEVEIVRDEGHGIRIFTNGAEVEDLPIESSSYDIQQLYSNSCNEADPYHHVRTKRLPHSQEDREAHSADSNLELALRKDRRLLHSYSSQQDKKAGPKCKQGKQLKDVIQDKNEYFIISRVRPVPQRELNGEKHDAEQGWTVDSGLLAVARREAESTGQSLRAHVRNGKLAIFPKQKYKRTGGEAVLPENKAKRKGEEPIFFHSEKENAGGKHNLEIQHEAIMKQIVCARTPVPVIRGKRQMNAMETILASLKLSDEPALPKAPRKKPCGSKSAIIAVIIAILLTPFLWFGAKLVFHGLQNMMDNDTVGPRENNFGVTTFDIPTQMPSFGSTKRRNDGHGPQILDANSTYAMEVTEGILGNNSSIAELQEPVSDKSSLVKPSVYPSAVPTLRPTLGRTSRPSAFPSQIANMRTNRPSSTKTHVSTSTPNAAPSNVPSRVFTPAPTYSVTATSSPRNLASESPINLGKPSLIHFPTESPTGESSKREPSRSPISISTTNPNTHTTMQPTSVVTQHPSVFDDPTTSASKIPSGSPSAAPIKYPSQTPTFVYSAAPSEIPTDVPSKSPSVDPIAASVTTLFPTFTPNRTPTQNPSSFPIYFPSGPPTQNPSFSPSNTPSRTPTKQPSISPTSIPSRAPSQDPSFSPSVNPTETPTQTPSIPPTNTPSRTPSETPTITDTQFPSSSPTNTPTESASSSPTRLPSAPPTRYPSYAPTYIPSVSPTKSPSSLPSESPTLQELLCHENLSRLEVYLTTDSYGSETSWDLVHDATGAVVASNAKYEDDLERSYTHFLCIPHGRYTFSIHDKNTKRICCDNGKGNFSVAVDGYIQGFGDNLGGNYQFTVIAPPTTTTTFPLPLESQEMTFYVMGDTPYNRKDEVILRRQLKSSFEDAKFAVHVGDFQVPTETNCSWRVLADRNKRFAECPIPLLMLPGDNDWAECSDPRGALSRWLKHFGKYEEKWPQWQEFAPLMRRQVGRPENFSFYYQNVLFIGLHVVRGSGEREKHPEDLPVRVKDCTNWVRENFTWKQHDRNMRAVIIFAHTGRTSWYKPFFNDFPDMVEDYFSPDFPVYYFHGNNHIFKETRLYNRKAQNIIEIIVDQGGKAPPLKVTINPVGSDEIITLDRQGGLY